MRIIQDYIRDHKIYQVVNKKCLEAPPDISLKRAIELMHDQKTGYFVVTHKRKIEGIFTENDVVRKVLGKDDVDWNKPIRDFMTPNPMVLTMNDSVAKAMDLMGKHLFYHIPLVDDQGNICGILSVRSLVRFLSDFYPTELYNLPPKSDQIMSRPEGG